MGSKQKRRIARLRIQNAQTLAVKLGMMKRIRVLEEQARRLNERDALARLFQVDFVPDLYRGPDILNLNMQFSRRALEQTRGNPEDIVVMRVLDVIRKAGLLTKENA